MSILIKNGHVVNAAEDFIADIYIEDEKIVTIGKNLNMEAKRFIDATGKLVFPGGIDPHVHLDMPFMGTSSSDNYETGTRAALHGGTTMVIDFILQTQGDTLHNALTEWQKKSIGNAICDYSYHMAVTDFNENTKKEIKKIPSDKYIEMTIFPLLNTVCSQYILYFFRLLFLLIKLDLMILLVLSLILCLLINIQ